MPLVNNCHLIISSVAYLQAIDLNRNGEWDFALESLNSFGELCSLWRAFRIVELCNGR
jgi:hypothetical protein